MGLIDLTSLSIKAKVATVVHGGPAIVLSEFILENSKTGSFRRERLQENEDGKHILFWQHFLKNEIVECE